MNTETQQKLIDVLRARFENNLSRHPGVPWPQVESRLKANLAALTAIDEMERTGGEPDVVAQDKQSGRVVFCDCSPESPAGRRSLCYDRKALDSRKANKPSGCVSELAAAMGVQLLNEQQYRALQELGAFDLKTSSWIETPEDVRALGGALFCDRRYGKVFVYHNGAESYYAARGFRGQVVV